MFQPGAVLNTVAFGNRPEQVETPHYDTRAPATTDTGQGFFPIGKFWVDTVGQNIYSLTNISTANNVVSATWVLLGSLSGGINTITGDTGGAESPSAGNFNLKGTSNQIAVTGSSNTETFSLVGPYTPATYTAHGVLIGEGTSSIVATTAGTDGQVLTGNTSADPTFDAIGTKSGLTAHGVLLAEGAGAFVATAVGTNGQVLLGSTGADPAFGTLTTSTGIAFTTGAGSLAVDIASDGFKINAASTGVTLVAQNAYTVTQAAQTSFALPATAAVGDTFAIASATGNTSGWIITQGAGQEIWAGTSHTTNGATGTLAGAIHTSVIIMCVVANNEFIVIGGTGLTGLTFT